jgi:hypothetical protein
MLFFQKARLQHRRRDSGNRDTAAARSSSVVICVRVGESRVAIVTVAVDAIRMRRRGIRQINT